MPHDNLGNYYHFREPVPLSLHLFRKVTSAGAVGAVAAAGGVLASDSTPIMGAEATTEAHVIIWAAANQDIIQAQIPLPPTFQGGDDVEIDLWVRTDNAGGGGIEAATFSVLTSWDNGSQVTDTATDSVPSETVHKVTAIIAAADIPDGASFVNVQLLPGTHANDPVRLLSARLTFVPRAMPA
jgi:hypothetical protein